VVLQVGHSGVGKSSLVNAIAPGLALATGDVTGYHGRGRHTTTRVSLLPLPKGGWVVDSPGIREFGLEHVPVAELARLFPGFDELPDACKYRNCLHRDEPKCAVRAAVEAGTFPRARYEGYRRLLGEVEGEG
jgi:ribosome biogenesis GTPase